MSYATRDDLVAYAAVLELSVPAQADGLLEAASRDLERVMGRQNVPVDLLLPEARGALQRACCAQALFRHAQGGDEMLGTDDGVASVGGIAFSMRQPARVSPLLVEELADHGLLARTSTVLPDPPPVRTPPLWPPWPPPWP